MYSAVEGALTRKLQQCRPLLTVAYMYNSEGWELLRKEAVSIHVIVGPLLWGRVPLFRELDPLQLLCSGACILYRECRGG